MKLKHNFALLTKNRFYTRPSMGPAQSIFLINIKMYL